MSKKDDKIAILEEIVSAQKELIALLKSQIVDLTMMSKIELGDDVIEEIKRLKEIINKDEQRQIKNNSIGLGLHLR